MIKIIKKRKSYLVRYSQQCMKKGNFGVPALFEMSSVFLALLVYIYKVASFDFSNIPSWLIITCTIVLIFSVPALTLLWTFTGEVIKHRYNDLRELRALNRINREVARKKKL